MHKEKIITVLGMLNDNIKTILDVGVCKKWNDDYKFTTVDCLDGADVKIDFNETQKLPFDDNSFDLVMANQLLEHLSNSEELISEMKRVARNYIFVGLPNELNWKARIRFLLGNPSWSGYTRYCHRHFFTIETIERFIKMFFGEYEKKEYWEPSKYRWFPNSLNRWLAKNIPTSFSKEVYYLINI